MSFLDCSKNNIFKNDEKAGSWNSNSKSLNFTETLDTLIIWKLYYIISFQKYFCLKTVQQ